MISEEKLIDIANNYIKTIEEKIGQELILPENLMIKKIWNLFYISFKEIL